jgi:methionine synthase II (cobalamin-independent)
MARFLSPTGGLATGVGGLPHTDPVRAVDDVLAAFPEVPYAPGLPNRGSFEQIVWNDASTLPGLEVAEGRLVVDLDADHAEAQERVFLDFVGQDASVYGPGPENYSGLLELAARDLSSASVVKGQVTGPVTFGMQIVDRDKRPILYDEAYADLLAKMLALRARAIEEVLAATGVAETLVVLNEPYWASLGSTVVPVSSETVRLAFEDIASLVEGGLGIHCCSNTDWTFVMDLDPAVISLDAHQTAKEFLLYAEHAAAYIERGGVVAWGVVPADARLFVEESTATLFARMTAIREAMAEYVDEGLLVRRSLITPSCGIRFATGEEADRIQRTTAEVARLWREGT